MTAQIIRPHFTNPESKRVRPNARIATKQEMMDALEKVSSALTLTAAEVKRLSAYTDSSKLFKKLVKLARALENVHIEECLDALDIATEEAHHAGV